MSLDFLLDPKNIQRRSAASQLSAKSWSANHFAYVVWDMSPRSDWISEEHPKRSAIQNKAFRPIYLGKATSWGGVRRHLTKDGVGCGMDGVSDKNLINEGLISYCLHKTEPGWLGMTFHPYASGRDAQAVEQAGVALLGWRRDVYVNKTLRTQDRQLAYAQGGGSWSGVVQRIGAQHRDLVECSTPLSEGILFNQTDPKPDSRSMI